MEENYGKVISNIRIAKGMPIRELISGICGRTAYSNFAMNRNHTSVDNFVKFLERLHISFTEFNYIANGFEVDNEQQFITDLQKVVAQKDVLRAEEMLKKAINYCYIYDENEIYKHLACITQLIINRLKGERLNKRAKKLITNYLMRCETWTHYELMLFNNVMFIFSLDQIRMLRKRVIHNLEKYQNLRVYGSESFRVLINMLMVFIEKQSYQDIRITMGLINNYKLNEDMLFEETLRLYFSGILNLIEQKIDDGMAEITKALNILQALNAKNYYENLRQYLKQIIMEYHLKINFEG